VPVLSGQPRGNIVIGRNGNVAEVTQVEHRLCRIDRRHLLRLRTKELAFQEGNTRLEVGILFVEEENDPGQLRGILRQGIGSKRHERPYHIGANLQAKPIGSTDF